MRILFQGDSITDGNRYKDESSRWDKNHQIGHTYAYIVTGLFTMKYPERGFEFINRGVSGNRTEELLERWERDTLSENPDVLCVLIGTNDTNCGYEGKEYDEDASGYEERYRTLLAQARAQNPQLKIVIMEPFAYIDTQAPSDIASYDFKKRKMKNVQAKARKIAKEFGAIFVPLQVHFDKIIDTPSAKYWMWDGVHPTEAGHALVARELCSALNKILLTNIEF
ncbi:MAG: SGNH/GDSL hydrolase family protein [Clostridia bacterium]|nr:SGNH/GDSL hydrolase family protein [Clostridia bacterium]